MDKSQPSGVRSESSSPDKDSQTEAVKPKRSDIDLANVRALMFALISICMFCVSILFGPDSAILPADGDLSIPFINAKVSRASFLYFGPILIIFISFYTYLFVFRILLNLKEGQGYSDQYIFTMKNSVARFATYCVFFWLPVLVLFGFVYKALPRPESSHVLGMALIFLIVTISLQLLLHVHQRYFWVVIVSLFVFVSATLTGFVRIDSASEGWLTSVHGRLHKLRPLSLVNVDLKGKDLRGVDISDADARTIQLQGSKLDNATLNNANLNDGHLEGAQLQNAKLNCTKLARAQLQKANLTNAELGGANLQRADFSNATLKKANFYRSYQEGRCERTAQFSANLGSANFDGAELIGANLSQTNLIGTILGLELETNMYKAKIIGADLDGATLSKVNLWKADLRCSILDGADLSGANIVEAKLGGANFKYANLNNTGLSKADFRSFNCQNEDCVVACIECIEAEDTGTDEKREGKNYKTKECEDCYSKCGSDANEGLSSNLSNATLKFADLENADLRGTTLTEADLEGADLNGADLRGAVGLTCKQLRMAENWEAAFRANELSCNAAIPSYPKSDDEPS